MSYMCTLRIKSKQTSCKEVRLDVVWGKCDTLVHTTNATTTGTLHTSKVHCGALPFLCGENEARHRIAAVHIPQDGNIVC